MKLMIFLTNINENSKLYEKGIRFLSSSCTRFVSEKRVPWHVAYAICTYTADSGHTWAHYMHFFPCLHTLFLLLQSQNVPSAQTTSAFLNRSYQYTNGVKIFSKFNNQIEINCVYYADKQYCVYCVVSNVFRIVWATLFGIHWILWFSIEKRCSIYNGWHLSKVIGEWNWWRK